MFQWKCPNEVSIKQVTLVPVLFFRYGLHKKLRDHYFNDLLNTSTTSRPEKKVLEGDQGEQYTLIDNDNLYAEPRQLKQGQYLYPVIFEPIKNIRLSISSYQVTTFVDLGPYFEYFEEYERYLNNFMGGSLAVVRSYAQGCEPLVTGNLATGLTIRSSHKQELSSVYQFIDVLYSLCIYEALRH